MPKRKKDDFMIPAGKDDLGYEYVRIKLLRYIAEEIQTLSKKAGLDADGFLEHIIHYPVHRDLYKKVQHLIDRSEYAIKEIDPFYRILEAALTPLWANVKEGKMLLESKEWEDYIHTLNDSEEAMERIRRAKLERDFEELEKEENE